MAKYKIKWDEGYGRFYAHREDGGLVHFDGGLVQGDTIEECEESLRAVVEKIPPTPEITEKEVEI